MLEFKPLEASDIEVRVQTVTEKGCSLLLYKDARCDMRQLDEVVGAENWDCSYSEINGKLFCEVGILCEQLNGQTQWVYKQDVGVPSRMESTKGEASDAFKRASFKWGIGRELYTAPFIWVHSGILQKHYLDDSTGNWTCRDKFHVKKITIEKGRITDLEIANEFDILAYQMHPLAQPRVNSDKDTVKEQTTPQKPNKDRFARIKQLQQEAVSIGIKKDGIDEWVKATFKGKDKRAMTDAEIKQTEKFIAGLIDDKKVLDGGIHG